MSPEQIAAIVLSVLAIGAGGVGAVQVTETGSQKTPPSWADESDGTINISVEGSVAPGENVTITATHEGTPVPHAPVYVNGEMAGSTDADGKLSLQVPDSDEFELEIEAEYEGERTIPLQSNDGDPDTDGSADEGADDHIVLTIDGNVTANESITVTASVNDTPLPGAAITVNGEFVGETAADGTIDIVVPAAAEELALEAEYEEKGEYEVEFEEREQDDEARTDPIQLRVNGTVGPGENVTVSAIVNDTPVENATVSVNDERIGQTDANGEIMVTLPETEEIEIEVETDTNAAELEYDFEESDTGNEFEETDDDEDDGSDEDDEVDEE